MKSWGFVSGVFGLLLANAAHADIAVADFARHEQYVDASISPDGEYLAAVAVVKGRRVLSLVHLADKKGVNLNPREGDELSTFQWIGPDRLIYTLGKHVGGEVATYATGELFTVKGDGTGAAILYGNRAGPKSPTPPREGRDVGCNKIPAARGKDMTPPLHSRLGAGACELL